MMIQKIRMFTRWCALAALLALPTLNLNAQTRHLHSGRVVLSGVAQSIWQQMPTPNPGGDNLIFSLSADSETDVWAVGDYISLNFDGQTWNAIPLAALPGQSSMKGVAAISPNNVWAVGSNQVSNGNVSHVSAVIEHYDGTKWSIVPSPTFSTGSELESLQAFSANDIVAVGNINTDSQHGQPLVEHFDGSKWTVVPTPVKKGQTAVLFGISGLSRSDFWVLGSTQPNGTPEVPLVAHFNGKRFTLAPLPAATTSVGGITEIANNDAWIVGSNAQGSTSTVHWDGNVWTVVPSPGATGFITGLHAVSAISSTDVWAAGGTSAFANLIEHWDGRTWTISPIQSGPGGFDELTTVLTFPSGSVFVAGSELACQGNICAGFEPAIFHTTQGL